MADKTMPPLPSGSVDMDAVHAAEAQGKDLAEALAKAVVAPKPRPVSDARKARLAARERAGAKDHDGLKSPAKPTPSPAPASGKAG